MCCLLPKSESILHSRTDEHLLVHFFSGLSFFLVLRYSYDSIPPYELLTFGGDFLFHAVEIPGLSNLLERLP